MNNFKQDIWVVLGPTASGKTDFSVQLAKKINAEIVVCDAYQMRQGLPLLTAKPRSQELVVPHHLLDEYPINISATVAGFITSARLAICEIQAKGQTVIICGGTGLYLRALLNGFCQAPPSNDEMRNYLKQEANTKGLAQLYERLKQVDPVAAQRIHPNDYVRIERALEVYLMTGMTLTDFHQKGQQNTTNTLKAKIKIGLDPGKEELSLRIRNRIDSMIADGLVDEVAAIYKQYGRYDNPPIGYSTVCDFIDGKIDFELMKELIYRQTSQYAKRQRTWFKKESDVLWFNSIKAEDVLSIVL